MKIFYSGYWKTEDVDSQHPIEADHSTTIDIFWNLDDEGSFLGVKVNEEMVFQVINNKNSWYAEILNTNTKEIQYSNLDHEKIEKLLDGVFRNEKTGDVSKELKIVWQKGSL